MDDVYSRMVSPAARNRSGRDAIVAAAPAALSGLAGHPGRELERDTANCFEASVLQRNLVRVFCEPDRTERAHAIAGLWTEVPVFYEEGCAASGREGVSRAAQRFLNRLAGRACVISGPVLFHRGLCLLRWHAQVDGRPDGTSGSQIAVFDRGRIDSLFAIEDDGHATPFPDPRDPGRPWS